MKGKVNIVGTGTAAAVTLDGDGGTITAGTNGGNGILSLHDSSSTIWSGVLINSQNRSITINSVLTPNKQGAYPVVNMDGTTGKVGIGGNGVEGNLAIYPSSLQGGTTAHEDVMKANVHVAGNDGFIRIGGAGGAGGHLALYSSSAKPADLHDLGKAAIHLDGQRGDIILANADCAEDFEITCPGEVEPGTVMVIGEDGGLQPSEAAYDRRVAGVLSGAKNLRPGIVLGRKPSAQRRYPIALAGQVYCKVDASQEAIAVGDLLTTSPTPGHAMRAADALKAFGAVIGKALTPLRHGQGMIRILVALQ